MIVQPVVKPIEHYTALNIMRDMCQVCHVALSGDVMTDDNRELYCNKCYDK